VGMLEGDKMEESWRRWRSRSEVRTAATSAPGPNTLGKCGGMIRRVDGSTSIYSCTWKEEPRKRLWWLSTGRATRQNGVAGSLGEAFGNKYDAHQGVLGKALLHRKFMERR